jgi:hypothetical protein
MSTTELCGHRWPVCVDPEQRPTLAAVVYHVCARVPDHRDDPALCRPGTCECRCGATTTAEEAS